MSSGSVTEMISILGYPFSALAFAISVTQIPDKPLKRREDLFCLMFQRFYSGAEHHVVREEKAVNLTVDRKEIPQTDDTHTQKDQSNRERQTHIHGKVGTSTNLLPLARSHLVKFPELFRIVTLVGHQAFST